MQGTSVQNLPVRFLPNSTSFKRQWPVSSTAFEINPSSIVFGSLHSTELCANVWFRPLMSALQFMEWLYLCYQLLQWLVRLACPVGNTGVFVQNSASCHASINSGHAVIPTDIFVIFVVACTVKTSTQQVQSICKCKKCCQNETEIHYPTLIALHIAEIRIWLLLCFSFSLFFLAPSWLRVQQGLVGRVPRTACSLVFCLNMWTRKHRKDK